MRPKRPAVTSEFHTAIAEMPQEKRVDALNRVVDLFAEKPEIYNEYQVAAFDDVIARLIEQVDEETQRELAERLAPIPNAPVEVIENLARSESIDVARPVLTQSERITSELLLEIAKTRGPQFAQAIARRKTLDPSVTAELVKGGDKIVLRLVQANKEAQIEDGGMDLVRRQTIAVGREKRQLKRIKARYTVWLELIGKREPLACQLIDISPGGARIKVASAEPLPPQLVIYLARGRQSARRCKVVWRRGEEAGLQFSK